MEKNIIEIKAPIDPDSMGEDGAAAPVRLSTRPAAPDPSRIVLDPTQDPRGAGFKDSPVAASGVQQLRAPQPVRISAEDEALASFVRDLGMEPEEVGIAVQAPRVSASRQRPPANGDMLETARNRALAVLKALPKGTELFVGGGALDESAVQLVMGIGFLIGKGLAVYRGDGHYCLSEAGRKG